MKHEKLRQLLFWALCCDLGLFAKKLIAPAANLITDALHIPGGIGTSFSLLFLVIGACVVPRFGSGTLMGLVQSVLAVLFGMTGSMGILAPIGYIIPGLIIDIVLWAGRKSCLEKQLSCCLANMFSAAAAALTANINRKNIISIFTNASRCFIFWLFQNSAAIKHFRIEISIFNVASPT